MMQQPHVLQLNSSSNFRDFGGYQTIDNRTVKKNVLFRSGVLSALTQPDIQELDLIGFKTVLDLRSRDELELFPNHWVKQSNINHIFHDYRASDINRVMNHDSDDLSDVTMLYKQLPTLLRPQLTLYFEQLFATATPIVINCSAGQDRTGFSVALVLHMLGVPMQTITHDYLLSTQHRRPEIEHGDIDLESNAETNDFARLLLRYSAGKDLKPKPLINSKGKPYLEFAFEEIDNNYGSLENYFKTEFTISQVEIAALQDLYLV